MPVSREAWVAAWAEDKVGELIKPLPIGWRSWRAEREVLYNQRQLGYADGIERAGIIGKYLLEHPFAMSERLLSHHR
jgi:hypothetical protein